MATCQLILNMYIGLLWWNYGIKIFNSVLSNPIMFVTATTSVNDIG